MSLLCSLTTTTTTLLDSADVRLSTSMYIVYEVKLKFSSFPIIIKAGEIHIRESRANGTQIFKVILIIIGKTTTSQRLDSSIESLKAPPNFMHDFVSCLNTQMFLRLFPFLLLLLKCFLFCQIHFLLSCRRRRRMESFISLLLSLFHSFSIIFLLTVYRNIVFISSNVKTRICQKSDRIWKMIKFRSSGASGAVEDFCVNSTPFLLPSSSENFCDIICLLFSVHPISWYKIQL